MARTRAAAETGQKKTKKTKAMAKAPTRKISRAEAKPPGIRGEKRVKETKVTVSVRPARRRRGMHDGPTNPAAIDRRKQFSGTDEPADPKRGSARRPAGGNAGRQAVGLPRTV
jgi:hypothetical protein